MSGVLGLEDEGAWPQNSRSMITNRAAMMPSSQVRGMFTPHAAAANPTISARTRGIKGRFIPKRR